MIRRLNRAIDSAAGWENRRIGSYWMGGAILRTILFALPGLIAGWNFFPNNTVWLIGLGVASMGALELAWTAFRRSHGGSPKRNRDS